MFQHRLLCLAVLSLSATLPSQAAVFKDPQLQSVWEGGKAEELDKLAQQRLKANPVDAQAAAAAALSALDGGEAAKVESAAKSMQQCVERQPKEAVCHFALGQLLGAQAMGASMFKAMSLAGKVKDAFSKAHELEPTSYEIRSALQQFYLMAPGMAGGSVSKAKELAQDVREHMPEHAKLLRARVAQHEGNWAEAERELASVKPGKDLNLQGDLREAWAALGLQYLRDKQYPKAKAVFEQLQRDQPQHAAAGYGLGRVATETGQLDEAIRQFERARTLEGAEALPFDHRLGVALQMKGDKAQAKQLLERFVTNKKANPRNVEDAKKRLAELG